jgi:hypothetical protein
MTRGGLIFFLIANVSRNVLRSGAMQERGQAPLTMVALPLNVSGPRKELLARRSQGILARKKGTFL